ncbi:MAG TPA: hypothetical protein GX743_06000 [Actinomycetales bacterium]|nr:hypothetical protein [Actinomycetales bacterium]
MESILEGLEVDGQPLIAYSTEDAEMLLESLAGSAEAAGITAEPAGCEAVLMGPYDGLLSVDGVKSFAMDETSGVAVVAIDLGAVDAAGGVFADLRTAEDACSSFTFEGGDAGEGSGTVTTSDVDVAGATDAYLTESLTEWSGIDVALNQVTVLSGESLIVVVDGAGQVSTDELVAVVEQAVANQG